VRVLEILKENLSKLNGPSGTKSVVGLDMGSSHIKVAQVGYNEGAARLDKFYCQKLEAKTKEARLQAVKNVFQKANIGFGEAVRMALGGEAIIVRYIEMPKMSKEELDKAIDFEVEKYIPFKREEVSLDSQIIEKEHHFYKNKMLVLLVVARNDFINKQIEIVRQAGINLSLIDIDSFALVNNFLLYGNNQPDKTIALLNMGARRTNINIIKNNLPFFTRDISVAGNDLTQAFMDKMKIEFPEAEKIKCSLEASEEDISDIMEPVLERLLVEVKLSFDYFENQVARGIDVVYLTGGSSVIKGLDKYFSDRLGLSVKYWNPALSMEAGTDISEEDLKIKGARLGVCLGLAVR